MGKARGTANTMSYPISQQPTLPPNTMIPKDEQSFEFYLNRLYEDIAFAVNAKDNNYFTIAVTNTSQAIPNVPNFGSFLLCLSATDAERDVSGNPIGWAPTLVAALCKSSNAAAGVITPIANQTGTGTWAPYHLFITATSTNFQINHDRAAFEANFNIKIIGTQS